MTRVMAIIAALSGFQPASGQNCQKLAVELGEVAAKDASFSPGCPSEPTHFDEDLDAVVKWKNECLKKANKENRK